MVMILPEFSKEALVLSVATGDTELEYVNSQADIYKK